MESTHTESLLDGAHETAATHWILTVVHHPEPDLLGIRRVLGEDSPALLGRAPRSFFPGAFELKSISREHAEVSRRGDHVEVRDLGSHNGTTVNGSKVARAPLCAGDIVGVGDVLLLLHQGHASYAEPEHPTLRGRSWPLARLLDQVERMAGDEENVVLVGATGTGKELVARALHEQSGRSGRFVAINCGGMAEGVLQSELFGHEKGAFSGAGAERAGLVAAAAAGTLFLDEIAAASPGLQATLLRLLESGEYRRVGSSQVERSSARFVAAVQPTDDPTHGLRPDLWYRLVRRRVDVPSLRDRRGDILVLAHHFAERCRGKPVRFSRRMALALLRHDWPGNVRELVAVVEQAALAEGDAPVLAGTDWLPSDPAPEGGPAKRRKKAKRPDADELRRVLAQCEGKVSLAAETFGVGRKTVYRWAEALGVDLDRHR